MQQKTLFQTQRKTETHIKINDQFKNSHNHAEHCKPTLLADANHSVTQNVIVTGVSTSATSDYCYHFYRAMHFSAKRGVAIACRLSVCLSVCQQRWWIVIT